MHDEYTVVGTVGNKKTVAVTVASSPTLDGTMATSEVMTIVKPRTNSVDIVVFWTSTFAGTVVLTAAMVMFGQWLAIHVYSSLADYG